KEHRNPPRGIRKDPQALNQALPLPALLICRFLKYASPGAPTLPGPMRPALVSAPLQAARVIPAAAMCIRICKNQNLFVILKAWKQRSGCCMYSYGA
ncbi:MAG: hypothetical protein K2I37_03205, partial [Muribaculaceae bacterium]|nr:hypothetical protein [Muribaculaceae bacterium]